MAQHQQRGSDATAEPAPLAHAATAALEQALAAPPDLTAAAFFDLDNTIIQGASLYYLARGLAARKYFTVTDLVRFGLRAMRFRMVAEHMDDLANAQDAALAFVAGKPVDEMRRVGLEIFDELMAERVWPGTIALARMHLAAGQRVYLVTAAPQELGEVIADRLGLTGALGTVAQVCDGVYTGRLVGRMLHGESKVDAIRKLAAEHGLDLARCSAYSDSVNDMPMLSIVGQAVAVNPDSALRRQARERGWEIRDFRTGRKAVKIAAPATLGAGVAVGVVVVAVALNRRRRGSRTGPAD